MNDLLIYIYCVSIFGIIVQTIRTIVYLNSEMDLYILEIDTNDLDVDYVEKLKRLNAKEFKVTMKSPKTIKKLIILNFIFSILIVLLSIPILFINLKSIVLMLIVLILILLMQNIISLIKLKKINEIINN